MKMYIRSSIDPDLYDRIDEVCYQTAADNEGSDMTFNEMVEVVIENLADEGVECGRDYTRKDVRDALKLYGW